MTREEQIVEAGKTAAEGKEFSVLVNKQRRTMSAYEIGFIEGAEWADSHPAWVSVEDELPPHRNQTNHKFENDFSVNCFVSDGKDVDTGYYDYRLRKWNCEFLTDVVYWYCPQPPRKEARNEND